MDLGGVGDGKILGAQLEKRSKIPLGCEYETECKGPEKDPQA